MSGAPFVLCVAGEDSGDRLGACVVRALTELGVAARGAGGAKMVAAGLQELVPLDDLAVCGIADVLVRLPKLYSHLQVLYAALKYPDCMGLVCIDYPGFNLRLKKRAESLGLPVWYVAPPQIWAWKPGRGRAFQGRDVAVLFPFEQVAYAACQAKVVRVAPMALHADAKGEVVAGAFLLLPGSRLPHLRRNLPLYVTLARELRTRTGARIVFVAARTALEATMHKELAGEFDVLNAANLAGFAGARGAICPPGTATLDLAWAGVPTLVSAVFDVPTYLLGRLVVRLPYWSLPSILLKRKVAKEAIFAQFPGLSPTLLQIAEMAQSLIDSPTESWATVACELQALLAAESLQESAKKILITWPGLQR